MARPTAAHISRSAIRHNFEEIRKKIGDLPVCAMVKADAYGHNFFLVAKELASLGVKNWGVHSLEEGLLLRQEKIAGPIIILGGSYAEELDEILANDLTPVFHDVENLRLFIEQARKSSHFSQGKTLGVHLKLDTGMGRLGIRPEKLAAFLTLFRNQKYFKITGSFAHVPRSIDREFTLSQGLEFEKMLSVIKREGFSPGICHHSNSIVSIAYPSMRYDMVRPGLVLYGINSHNDLQAGLDLRPVMRFVSKIVSIRDIPSGTGLSYGHTYHTQRPSRIATVPVGYADGYPRACGNRSQVVIRGKRAPIVGRVCMDMSLVDVTDIADVQWGDPVTLFGEDPSVHEIADLLDTIAYEILCGISPRVPRILVD